MLLNLIGAIIAPKEIKISDVLIKTKERFIKHYKGNTHDGLGLSLFYVLGNSANTVFGKDYKRYAAIVFDTMDGATCFREVGNVFIPEFVPEKKTLSSDEYYRMLNDHESRMNYLDMLILKYKRNDVVIDRDMFSKKLDQCKDIIFP